MRQRNSLTVIAATSLAFLLLSGFSFPFHRKKYEKPISKDTLQPDKVLFDRAIRNIEKGNYEVARLTLNTLINTYDTSEFLAKAKLAIADSWYREGGTHGLAQAEAEYKDFILFYPTMAEAAESQYKVCEIHYKQMEKADRDASQGTRAEDECRQVLVQFPNAAPFNKKAEQMLRNVQEVLADKEFRAGDFYHHKGSYPAAASRFAYVTSQYPLYSAPDEALWSMADSYKKMGDRFETQEGDALAKLVKEYPLSSHVDGAKERLTALKRAIPQADPAAYARQKYELENRTKAGMLSKAVGLVSGHPDTRLAAKMGTPAMQTIRPMVPVSVPQVAAGGQNGVSDVVGGVVNDTANLDKSQDARMSSQNGVVKTEAVGTGEQKASVSSNGQGTGDNAKATEVVPPTNHPATAQQIKQYEKLQAKAKAQAERLAKKQAKSGKAPAAAPAPADQPAGAKPAASTPAAATPAATPAKP